MEVLAYKRRPYLAPLQIATRQRIGNAHPLEDNHSMSSKKVTSNMIRGAKCLKKELFLGTEMTPDQGQLTYIKLNKKKTRRGRV